MAHYRPDAPHAAPVCNFTNTQPKQAHCIAPFDVKLTHSIMTRAYLELLAWNTNSYEDLLKRTVTTAGLYGYGGFLSGVNLCTPKVSSRMRHVSRTV